MKYERPHQLPLVLEALDIMFKKPSSMFYTMSALDVILKGFEIDCSGTEYAVKVVCAEMRRTKGIKTLNEEKTLLRVRWFDRVR